MIPSSGPVHATMDLPERDRSLAMGRSVKTKPKTPSRDVFYRHRNTEFIRDMVRQNRRIERASCVQRLGRRLPLRDLKQMTCGKTRITFAATDKAMKKALTAPSKPVKVTA